MAAAKGKGQYHHGDLAAQLAEVTLALLEEVGHEGFTLREAARRAGVNHRAIYRHYADKRALLAMVATRGYERLAADMHEASNAGEDATSVGTGSARLLAICEAYVRFARARPGRYSLMFGQRYNEDGAFPELGAAVERCVDILKVAIRLIAPEAHGLVRRDAGITLWSSVHGLSTLVLARHVPLGERHVSRYVRTVMAPVVQGLVVTLQG
jgi:AcrR family transcriptional regulator